jgi:hypothetical protein
VLLELLRLAKCAYCSRTCTGPCQAACGHSLCEGCMVEVLKGARSGGDGRRCRCPTCGELVLLDLVTRAQSLDQMCQALRNYEASEGNR